MPEQWVRLNKWSTEDISLRTVGAFSCILELRDRIEALEAAQPRQDKMDRLIALDRDNLAIQPPTLKKQALEQLDGIATAFRVTHCGDIVCDKILAALKALPEPQGPSDEELGRRFRVWWHNEGSGLPPLPGMDHEEHVRRISEIAWANGAYAARWGAPANNTKEKN
jgi:hypothetical protein